MASDEEKVRALAQYIASKGGGGASMLEDSYTQFITESKRRVEAQVEAQVTRNFIPGF